MNNLKNWKESLGILIFFKIQFHKNNILNNKICKKVVRLKYLTLINQILANLELLNNQT